MNVNADSSDNAVPAVRAEHTADGYGVFGLSQGGSGIVGTSKTFHAIFGAQHGENVNAAGVFGTHGSTGPGVMGQNDNGGGGTGVVGFGTNGSRGVAGFSDSWQGVYGHSSTNAGVVGEADHFHAIFGAAHDVNSSGLYAYNDAGGFGVSGISAQGVGLYGEGNVAGRFKGNVEVGGNISVTGDVMLTNADGAEDFEIAEAGPVEPGTVMVLGDTGALRVSRQAYDRRVAGIVSGAGDYQPALILDRQAESEGSRLPIALFGKVFCKVDAQYGPVRIGDLLTTSPTPGHAMKAADPMNAFGSVIGKALGPLEGGLGLIPVLVALQ
jgi:hypothetical protein